MTDPSSRPAPFPVAPEPAGDGVVTANSAPKRPTAAYALVTLSGLAALSWEALWQLEAALAFGISATATALAVTMGGMAAGALLSGSLLTRRASIRPLRYYGLLELAIGGSGLLLRPGFQLLEAVDSHVFSLSPGLAPVLFILGTALLLGPPTLAMGATVPVFPILARGRPGSVAALYGFNTTGAALGVLAFAFVLLPALGVNATVRLLALVNLSVGAAAWWLGGAERRLPARAGTSFLEDSPRPGFGTAQIVVFATGFVTFGLEVAWFRALRVAFWSTTQTFAINLAAVLVPLAIGAHWLRGCAAGASPPAFRSPARALPSSSRLPSSSAWTSRPGWREATSSSSRRGSASPSSPWVPRCSSSVWHCPGASRSSAPPPPVDVSTGSTPWARWRGRSSPPGFCCRRSAFPAPPGSWASSSSDSPCSSSAGAGAPWSRPRPRSPSPPPWCRARAPGASASRVIPTSAGHGSSPSARGPTRRPP